MCDYTRVEYACGHLRFTVRAWCKSLLLEHRVETDQTGIKYQETHKRCPPHVVAIEYRIHERCGESPCHCTISTEYYNTHTVQETAKAPPRRNWHLLPLGNLALERARKKDEVAIVAANSTKDFVFLARH